MRRPFVFIGYDPEEADACCIAHASMAVHVSQPVNVTYLDQAELVESGLYTRETKTTPDEQGRLRRWDAISEAPMSTTHAIARFFVPLLSGYQGWALFVDGDVLVRDDIAILFAQADPHYAVQVVKHPPMPEQATKKDGATQTSYSRKNWSSVMLFNCEHPAHWALTPGVLNRWPGRDLHAFRWLDDDQIGTLEPRWNHLVGVSAPSDVAIAHFTLGLPTVAGHEQDEFADEWFGYRREAMVPHAV